MPSEGAPGWATNAPQPTLPAPQPPPTPPAQPISPVTRRSEIEETKPAALMSDATKPASIEVPGENKRKKDRYPVAKARPPSTPKAPPVPAPESASASAPGTMPVALSASAPATPSEVDDDDSVTDFGLVVALSSLCLVCVAVIATLFPFGRLISAVIAGVGLLGGLASLGAEGRARLAGGLAIGIHLLILTVVLIAPSWLGLDSWQLIPIEDKPPPPQAFSHDNKHGTTLAQWVDSSSASWQFKDVRVTINSATVAPLEIADSKGLKRKSKEQYLQLVLFVKNIGAQRPVDMTGWAIGLNPEQAQLTDSAGRSIKPATFEEGWQPEPPVNKPLDRLYPGKGSEIRLIYSAPQPRIDFLRLALPGTTFGFEEEIKFQINSGAIILMAPPKK
jgi:hypothetical protein